MADAKTFARRMNVRSRGVAHAANAAAQYAAISALRTAVLATPVDTGRARGGWDVNLGAPGSSGTRLDPSGSAAIGEGLSVIQSKQPERAVWISNTVEYIGPLENGYSAQAPGGMTRQAVIAAQVAVRASRILKK